MKSFIHDCGPAGGSAVLGRVNNLCYIHIYKCGGISFRQYIKENLVTSESSVIDQGAYEWEGEVQRYDRLLGNMARAELLRFIVPADSRNVVLLSHTFFYEFMKSVAAFFVRHDAA
jgi:hypothetical protein